MGQRQGDVAALLWQYATVATDDHARAVMRLSVLDWAACGIAGQRAGAFDVWARAVQEPGRCTRFDGALSGPSAAALVNGTLSHALDYDDTHFDHIGHPSVVVLPAALAVAEVRGASFDDMLDAALVGAEALVAVGIWLGRAHYQVGFHQTATAGAFGAMVAAARILELGPAAFSHAVGLCATMASGLKAQFGTMGKPLNAGLAARCGVEAALWAEAGLTSTAESLDGPLGFGATHHGEGAEVPFAWRMARVSHKFHACCHGLHAALEAVRGVGLQAADTVEVRTHPRWLTVCNQPAPDTGLGAKFSYAHVLAMAAFGHDTSDIAAFTDACAQDADLVRFRSCVRVVADPGLSEMQAVVTVDGVAHEGDLDVPQPMSERAARVRSKARTLVGAAQAERIWQAMEQGSLDAFAKALHSEI